jgi:hypothetical protein
MGVVYGFKTFILILERLGCSHILNMVYMASLTAEPEESVYNG